MVRETKGGHNNSNLSKRVVGSTKKQEKKPRAPGRAFGEMTVGNMRDEGAEGRDLAYINKNIPNWP